MLHVLLLYIGSEWPFRYITSNQNAKTDPKICLLHISPLPIPYILFLLSRTSPTTHLFPSPSPCFFSPLHHFTSSVSHSSSCVGFISSNKCPFFFLPLSPLLFHPSPLVSCGRWRGRRGQGAWRNPPWQKERETARQEHFQGGSW